MWRFSLVIAVAAMCHKDGWQVLQRTVRPHEMRRMILHSEDFVREDRSFGRENGFQGLIQGLCHQLLGDAMGCFLGGDSRIVCGMKRHMQPFTQNPDGLSLRRFKNAMWIEDSSKTAPSESFCDRRIPSRRIQNKVASNEPGFLQRTRQQIEDQPGW